MVRAPRITVVHAPRGSGKSHYLANEIARTRDSGESATWIDASDSTTWQWNGPAGLIALDSLDPRDASQLALARQISAAVRSGTVGRAIFASRSAALLEHHRHPWLYDYRVVDRDDLALDLEGVLALATRTAAPITPSAAEIVHAESEGWAWAVLLGITAVRDNPHATPDDLRRTIRQRIHSAIAGELSLEQRIILTASTIIDADVLRAAGVDDPWPWLTDAEADGWLTRTSETRFSVPGALSRALRERPDGLQQHVTETASHIIDQLLRLERLPDAIDIALASDSAELIHRAAHQSGRRGRLMDLHRIADALKDRDPDWFGPYVDLLGATVLMGRGSTQHFTDWQHAARELLRRAQAKPGSLVDLLYHHAIRTVSHRALGDLEASLDSARRSVATWNRAHNRTRGIVGAAAIALDSAAITFILAGEAGEALSASLESVSCARRLGDPALVTVTKSTLATIQVIRGDLTSAEAVFAEIVETTTQLPPRVLGHVGKALLAAEQHDLATAREASEWATRASRAAEYWWLADYVAAVLDEASGSKRAFFTYAEAVAQGQHQGQTLTAPTFHALRLSELYTLSGRHGHAQRLLANLPKNNTEVGLLHAIIDLATGNWDAALQWTRTAPPPQTPRSITMRTFIRAVAAAAAGQESVAAEHLTAATTRALEWGLWSPLRFFSQDARALLTSTSARIDDELRSALMMHLGKWRPVTPAGGAMAQLSKRESEVVAHLSTGAKLADIAADLGVSHNTVKTLVRRIYLKLGVSNRTDAVNLAISALIRASLGMAVAMSLIGFAQNAWQLVALRLLAGLLGGYSSGSTILVAAQAPKERSAWALGVLASAIMAGNIAGPLLGGLLAEFFGVQAAFFAVGGLIFLAFLATAFFLKEDRPARDQTAGDAPLSAAARSRTAKQEGRGWRAIPHRGVILSLLGLSAILMFATVSAEPVITVHVERLTGGAGPAAILSAIVFSLTALGTILSAPWLGRQADRIGHLRVLSYSLTAATVLLALQALAPNLWVFAALRFLTGLALGGITPTVVASIRRLVPDTSVGLVLGYNISAQYVGQVAGPIIAGALGGALGTSSVFAMTAAATAIGLVGAVLVRRRLH